MGILNAESLTFELKRLAMRVLALLACKAEHIPVLHSALAELTTAFETVFKLITGPESRVVCNQLQSETMALLYRISGFELSVSTACVLLL